MHPWRRWSFNFVVCAHAWAHDSSTAMGALKYFVVFEVYSTTRAFPVRIFDTVIVALTKLKSNIEKVTSRTAKWRLAVKSRSPETRNNFNTFKKTSPWTYTEHMFCKILRSLSLRLNDSWHLTPQFSLEYYTQLKKLFFWIKLSFSLLCVFKYKSFPKLVKLKIYTKKTINFKDNSLN